MSTGALVKEAKCWSCCQQCWNLVGALLVEAMLLPSPRDGEVSLLLTLCPIQHWIAVPVLEANREVSPELRTGNIGSCCVCRLFAHATPERGLYSWTAQSDEKLGWKGSDLWDWSGRLVWQDLFPGADNSFSGKDTTQEQATRDVLSCQDTFLRGFLALRWGSLQPN